jgi:hypothetical protein
MNGNENLKHRTDQCLSLLAAKAREERDDHLLHAIGIERRRRGRERAALLDAILSGASVPVGIDAEAAARGRR